MQVVGGALAYDVWATVSGGGMSAQAGAIRLGVARALQAFDAQHRVTLKEHRLLTQDDRQVRACMRASRGGAQVARRALCAVALVMCRVCPAASCQLH